MVIEADIGTKIAGFQRYRSPSLNFAPKINVWYPGMGDWCRICLAEGHRSSVCPTKSRRWEKAADEFEDLTEWKGHMEKLKSEYADRIEPFFTKENPFSNHFLCEVEVEGYTYKSTEHCLFVQRAVHCKDEAAAEEIRKAPTAKDAMKRGRLVPFPGGAKPWHQWAKTVLETANFAKFTQNAELRRHLFNTNGKRLVEASSDSFWGCGHSLEALKKNPKIRHPDQWQGYNVMGDILTHLRRNLMSDKAYGEEASEARANRGAKRPRESPGELFGAKKVLTRADSESSSGAVT